MCCVRAIRFSMALLCIFMTGCAQSVRQKSYRRSPVCPAWTVTGRPVTWGDDILSVLMGTLPETEPAERLANTDAAVVMKIGQNLNKIKRALHTAGRADEAYIIEYATMPRQSVCRLKDYTFERAPYFSIIVLHGKWAAHPHDRPAYHSRAGARVITNRLHQLLNRRLPAPPMWSAISRMWLALPRGTGLFCTLPITVLKQTGPVRLWIWRRPGRWLWWSLRVIRVCLLWPPRCLKCWRLTQARWQDVEVTVLPGITAMLAAAARVGAPLGHDFCVINLSDNLKPWALIENRIQLALQADFAMAFYNPRSKSRPEGFENIAASEILW